VSPLERSCSLRDADRGAIVAPDRNCEHLLHQRPGSWSAFGATKPVGETNERDRDTKRRLSLKWRAIFWLILKPQIVDTETQQRSVQTSGLDWVVAQPVALTDGVEADAPFTSLEGVVRSMAISRRRVATFLADAAETAAYDREVVALS
jgi:NAD(P)H-binding